MLVGDSPAASSPSNPSSAGRKSPLDSPRRYRIGNTSATLGERRTQGAGMRGSQLRKNSRRPRESLGERRGPPPVRRAPPAKEKVVSGDSSSFTLEISHPILGFSPTRGTRR